MSLLVVSLDQIRSVATPPLVFRAVRDALIAHAEGRTSVPPPMLLEFPAYHGDCHVKAGHVQGSPYFAVKLASTFASANNGLVIAVDATTGEPAAVLADEGRLTSWRTAAAGALMTHAMTPAGVDDIAILGTGDQARLQALWLSKLRPSARFRIWGRRPEAADELCATLAASGLDVSASHSPSEAAAPCVVATTAARQPLPAELFAEAIHVTGIGTDMPGKCEVPVAALTDALVATDDHEQCLDHGDFGNAVRAGILRRDADIPAGSVLRDGLRQRPRRTIADLTGVGAADTAVAAAVLGQLVPPTDATEALGPVRTRHK